MKYEIKDGEFKPGRRWRVTDHPTGDVLPCSRRTANN